MKHLLDFNLKKIQYFLSIVEEGSMSKAAHVLYVSQPLLSKNIKELENSLHVTLFTRKNKQLQLTQAGKYLYEEWKTLVEKIGKQVESAKEIAMSKQYRIHFGCEHIMALGANELWMKEVIAFQQEHEEVAVNMSTLGLKECKEKLTNGLIDVMLCTSFDALGLEKEYHVKRLCGLPVYLYGRKKHPVLSQKETIDWSDLKDCSFYTISPEIATWPEELLLSYTMIVGYRPNIAGYTKSQMSQLLKIKTSDSIMLSLELKTLLEDELLCARRMDSTTEVVLVWKKGNALLDMFVDKLIQTKNRDKITI